MIEVTEKGAVLTVNGARGYFPEAAIINAIEKQMPKKPHEDFPIEYCPMCSIRLYPPFKKYCSDCGQALDWSDEE